jgi:hypothetical protein
MTVSRNSWSSSGTVIEISPASRSEVDVGQQADRGPAVPGPPADDLPGVQTGALLGHLVIFLNAPAGGRDGDQPRQAVRIGLASGQM